MMLTASVEHALFSKADFKLGTRNFPSLTWNPSGAERREAQGKWKVDWTGHVVEVVETARMETYASLSMTTSPPASQFFG